MQQNQGIGGFVPRKIHSLLGVIPLGLFLLEHVFTNSMALFGEAFYLQTVALIHSIPQSWIIRVFFIALPLTFHGVVGMIYAFEARNNPRQYPYFRNWMFYFQRVTGIITFIFVIYHVISFKFGPLADLSAYDKVATQFANPFLLVFYVVGLLSAIFHFTNGLWGFAINWGIITGLRAQQVFSYVTMAFFVVFSLYGLLMMSAFM